MPGAGDDPLANRLLGPVLALDLRAYLASTRALRCYSRALHRPWTAERAGLPFRPPMAGTRLLTDAPWASTRRAAQPRASCPAGTK